MNPIETMLLHEDEFTKSEQIIRDCVIKNPDLIACFPLVSVAKEMKVSKSALLRFCQKCGYNGFTEFKYEISRYLHAGKLYEDKSKSSISDICNHFIDAIRFFQDNALEVQLEAFAKDILAAKKIRIVGVHESGLPARYLQYRLTTIGVDADYVESAVACDKATLTNEDELYIFFSLSTTTPDIVECIGNAMDRECKIALITQNDHSRYRGKINHFILIPSFDLVQNRMFLDAQYLNFIIAELLIHVISGQS